MLGHWAVLLVLSASPQTRDAWLVPSGSSHGADDLRAFDASMNASHRRNGMNIAGDLRDPFVGHHPRVDPTHPRPPFDLKDPFGARAPLSTASSAPTHLPVDIRNPFVSSAPDGQAVMIQGEGDCRVPARTLGPVEVEGVPVQRPHALVERRVAARCEAWHRQRAADLRDPFTRGR